MDTALVRWECPLLTATMYGGASVTRLEIGREAWIQLQEHGRPFMAAMLHPGSMACVYERQGRQGLTSHEVSVTLYHPQVVAYNFLAFGISWHVFVEHGTFDFSWSIWIRGFGLSGLP